jgi:hypothetical protein
MTNHHLSNPPPSRLNGSTSTTMDTSETPSDRPERFHPTNTPKACDVSISVELVFVRMTN